MTALPDPKALPPGQTAQPSGRADLHTVRSALRAGQTDAASQMADCLAAAHGPRNQHTFLQIDDEPAQAAARNSALAAKPLAGLAFSVKDLFDVRGQVTRAGSIALAAAPPALADCPAVARLRAAGGVLVGRTNMVEFAFSGVGVNPHYGTPSNAGAADMPRVPGGSSSGAAVSVATGAAFIGLGSDTGGSIRIPAALNGIVGFKNTARRVPTTGAFPLSSTMDTVCALTRSVRDAILAHEVLAARRVVRSTAPLSQYRLAVAQSVMLDNMDSTVTAAWARTLQTLRAGGAQITEIALPELHELAAINATGGFSPAEAYAVHFPFLNQHQSVYDPRVLARIQRGAGMSAREYIELVAARRDWIARMELALGHFDAVLSPTVPIVAPPIAEVDAGAERDDAFFRANGLLLRNTAVVNMLDGCAISIPCHSAGELPVGLMVWAPAMQDDTVLNLALEAEKILQ